MVGFACGSRFGLVLKPLELAGGVVWTGVVLILLDAPLLFVEPPEINKVETRHKTPITPAKIHVPFSSTSVVCFTPIN